MIVLLFLLIFTAQEPKITTCKVVEVNKTVSCEGRRRTVPRVDWLEWKLATPIVNGGVHPDGQLSKRELAKGDLVKATITDGELVPVADCQVRVWRNMQTWLSGRRGERMPLGLWTEPDDCQPWYGKQE